MKTMEEEFDDKIKAKDEQIAELEAKNTQLEQDNLTTLEALAEVYELMLGGI